MKFYFINLMKFVFVLEPQFPPSSLHLNKGLLSGVTVLVFIDFTGCNHQLGRNQVECGKTTTREEIVYTTRQQTRKNTYFLFSFHSQRLQ